MDISDTLAPKSDQLDNVDLIGGARDFTIAEITRNSSPDQPVNIKLAEFDRPWRPNLTMRRLLSHVWGTTDSSQWIGRRVRLYRDPSVTFGKDTPGGTRVSHVSHIDKKVTATLPISKGRVARFVVEPLVEQQRPAAPPSQDPSADEIAACTDIDTLKRWWSSSSPAGRTSIEARVAQLKDAS